MICRKSEKSIKTTYAGNLFPFAEAHDLALLDRKLRQHESWIFNDNYLVAFTAVQSKSRAL
jgi:hypothetical protein